jgi:hypothetical protein
MTVVLMSAYFVAKVTDRVCSFSQVFDAAIAAYPPSQPSPARGEGVYGLRRTSVIVVKDHSKAPFPPCGGKGWGWGVRCGTLLSAQGL